MPGVGWFSHCAATSVLSADRMIAMATVFMTWIIRRLAWLQNFRRIVMRYERFPENFLGVLHLACCLILMRGL